MHLGYGVPFCSTRLGSPFLACKYVIQPQGRVRRSVGIRRPRSRLLCSRVSFYNRCYWNIHGTRRSVESRNSSHRSAGVSSFILFLFLLIFLLFFLLSFFPSSFIKDGDERVGVVNLSPATPLLISSLVFSDSTSCKRSNNSNKHLEAQNKTKIKEQDKKR